MASGNCYIGTSGWSYPHWAKGRFYPRGLKPGEWLAYLSQRFNTVEVNSSFYRPPRPEMIDRWRGVTSEGFRFAVKLWRRITHDKRLAACDSELADFFAIVNGLGPKRGPLLVQLPPSFRKDVARLDGFLAQLTPARRTFTSTGRNGGENSPTEGNWRVAVEFRNKDWLSSDVYELLAHHDAAVSLVDLPRCPINEPNDASFVYIRRHGPGGGYRGCYTTEQISADASRIRQWISAGKDVFVYYNNDIDGHAVDNASQLSQAVDR